MSQAQVTLWGAHWIFAVGKTAKITLEKLSLEKLFPFLKQPDYAKGELSGTVVLDDVKKKVGPMHYMLIKEY